MQCPGCKIIYPDELLNSVEGTVQTVPICPICASQVLADVHGITRMQVVGSLFGSINKRLYARANKIAGIRWVKPKLEDVKRK